MQTINYAAGFGKLPSGKGSIQSFFRKRLGNGTYFEKRGYDSPEWKKLAEEVRQYGMRNAYLLAVAPTSSTSILAGTTAGIDPVMNKFFLKKNGAV